MRAFKCRQCGSPNPTITKGDLRGAGLPTSDKKITTNFCSLACHEAYEKRLNAREERRIIEFDEDASPDGYWCG